MELRFYFISIFKYLFLIILLITLIFVIINYIYKQKGQRNFEPKKLKEEKKLLGKKWKNTLFNSLFRFIGKVFKKEKDSILNRIMTSISEIIKEIKQEKRKKKKSNKSIEEHIESLTEFFLNLYFSIAFFVLLMIIEMIFFYLLLLSLEWIGFAEMSSESIDKNPVAFLLMLVSVTTLTYLSYRFLVIKIKKYLSVNRIKKTIIPWIKWTNIYTFFLSTYTVLLSLYYSSIKSDTATSEHINIFIYTLIFAIAVFVNNSHLSHLTQYIEGKSLEEKIENKEQKNNLLYKPFNDEIETIIKKEIELQLKDAKDNQIRKKT